MYKETNRMCPCRHPNIQCMFHLPFIHAFCVACVFWWCSSNVLWWCSNGVMVKNVFERNIFSHDNTEYDKHERPNGVQPG